LENSVIFVYSSDLWLQVVAELGQPDEAGSLTDLGLRPGGRIKLIKSNTVVLENPLRFVQNPR